MSLTPQPLTQSWDTVPSERNVNYWINACNIYGNAYSLPRAPRMPWQPWAVLTSSCLHKFPRRENLLQALPLSTDLHKHKTGCLDCSNFCRGCVEQRNAYKDHIKQAWILSLCWAVNLWVWVWFNLSPDPTFIPGPWEHICYQNRNEQTTTNSETDRETIKSTQNPKTTSSLQIVLKKKYYTWLIYPCK
jgi:hypothetical protein